MRAPHLHAHTPYALGPWLSLRPFVFAFKARHYMNNRNPRRSYKRDVLWKRVKAMGQPCHICGLPIDPSLPAHHPYSFELDEVVPISKGGSACSVENVAASHRCCNQWKSNKDMRTVAAVREKALRSYGKWSSPAQFVEFAKAAARGLKRPGPSKTPGGLPTSREW